ncbi:hypothetical protein HUG15_05650 [Salicibibacter cibarius]|uniref:Uncharacterized protein n=1 Tax=Salicibibacter cibarius TaxID=2743000 RepID=A0A7T7CAN2_9BACI|nr:hypothetical protein [Salicibibacter cibarius]QQK75077.1 hypothetical protein HUG15_05315 [Salicibibacter cibarius]QQK75138.1 hypothetical protein HUG15_05650 [Salicibibacter cibarius]
MNKDTWIKTKDLDTPLNQVFPGTMTRNTVRDFVRRSEKVLSITPENIEKMGYIKLNRYVDKLDKKLMELEGEYE